MTEKLSREAATVVFSCSGGTNVGQVANQAAVELHREGIGSMRCLAGIGSGDESLLSEGRTAERVVGIDGCPAACARKALEQAGLALTDHVIVTDLGLEKKPHGDMPDAKNVTRVKNAVKARLDTVAGGPFCS